MKPITANARAMTVTIVTMLLIRPMVPPMIPVPSDLNTNCERMNPMTVTTTAIATHLPAM